MPDSGRLSDLGEQGSRAVMEAAAALEGELAAGLVDAKAAGDRLADEHRVDQEEFDKLVRRVSENTHQLIDAVSARVLGSTTGDAAEQTQMLTTSAHDIVDLLLKLSSLAPGLANHGLATAFGPPPADAQEPDGRHEG
ncbi:hypothetical protein F7Q99_00765 [Streptomyces kaniharaensis]|uniref:Uncharacterized protein n=1 Tax=Streptomyces kaniharaensis TaxID=212423 RepID=A0A6N7KHJ8_9ACTN|nr:hypothetical protein [Streptomyces kaniharaensis]MQS10846.1 hypothetical protein [Streptomyces kaniharaensis]